jgi:hypothetical protein
MRIFNLIKTACAIWTFVCIIAGIPLGILINMPVLSLMCTVLAILITLGHCMEVDNE